jgi:hypothetical protein
MAVGLVGDDKGWFDTGVAGELPNFRLHLHAARSALRTCSRMKLEQLNNLN